MKTNRTLRLGATAVAAGAILTGFGLGADPAKADEFNGSVDVTCTAIGVATQDIFDDVFGPGSFAGVELEASIAAQATQVLDPGEVGDVQTQIALHLPQALVDHLEAAAVPSLAITDGASQMGPSGDLVDQNTLFGWDADTVAVADGMDLESGVQDSQFQAVVVPLTGNGQMTLHSFTIFSESTDDEAPAELNVSCLLDTDVVLDVEVTGVIDDFADAPDVTDPDADPDADVDGAADAAEPVVTDPAFTG